MDKSLIINSGKPERYHADPSQLLSLFDMYDVNQGLDFPELHVKGQLISKGLFGAKLDQNNNEIFLRISALASKRSSNQKTLLYNYVK